jgi:hypothetical protein
VGETPPSMYPMKNILLVLILLLVGCDYVVKPDFVKNGREYVVRTICVQSHIESKYEYHYGYNFSNSKFDWHWGLNDVTICDKSALDTVEVNIEKKYYNKK